MTVAGIHGDSSKEKDSKNYNMNSNTVCKKKRKTMEKVIGCV